MNLKCDLGNGLPKCVPKQCDRNLRSSDGLLWEQRSQGKTAKHYILKVLHIDDNILPLRLISRHRLGSNADSHHGGTTRWLVVIIAQGEAPGTEIPETSSLDDVGPGRVKVRLSSPFTQGPNVSTSPLSPMTPPQAASSRNISFAPSSTVNSPRDQNINWKLDEEEIRTGSCLQNLIQIKE